MHPVLRRILLHGGLTALLLAVMGVMLAELANVWLIGNAPRGANPNVGNDAQIGAELRTRVPLMLAGWGFLFVLIGELVIWRVRGHRPPPKPPENPQDDAEKLLNELLAQAEAKMAAETGDRGQSAAGGGQNTEGREQKPESGQHQG